MTKVLGIDPGYNTAGYCVLQYDMESTQYHYVESGVLKFKDNKLCDKMLLIYNTVNQLVSRVLCQALILEDIYVSINVKSTVKLAYMCALSILSARQHNMQITKLSVKLARKQVLGFGNVTKEEVNDFVKSYLCLRELSKDESDAALMCMCYHHL